MIKKTFVFEVGEDHAHYFQKAQAVASAAGASLSGSALDGRFNHRGVRGSYRVRAALITVDLDKPIGIPWGPMERALERFFGQKPQPQQVSQIGHRTKSSSTNNETERHDHATATASGQPSPTKRKRRPDPGGA